MALRINDIAPDFTAETTHGTLKFHDWLGQSWGFFFRTPRISPLFAQLSLAPLPPCRMNLLPATPRSSGFLLILLMTICCGLMTLRTQQVISLNTRSLLTATSPLPSFMICSPQRLKEALQDAQRQITRQCDLSLLLRLTKPSSCS